MNRTLLTAASLFVIFLGRAQDWSWSRSGNGTGEETSNHITIDATGNLIITGSFSSPTATISAIPLTNTGASGTKEVLVAKYDASGTLLWAKRGQGNADDEGIAVTCDPTGNIYVAGNYESPTIIFGTATLTNNSSSGFTDVFVVKYDPAGNVLWARSYGGSLLDNVRSIKADNSGNTYIAGTFRSLSVSFGAYGVINAGNSDAYMAKMDVNGTPLWAKQIGGAQLENGLNVTHDGSGNVYVMGDYNSSTLASYTLTNAGGVDIFIGKYDGSSGNLLATKTIGGALNETGYYMVTDASGNLYLSGSFESTSLNLGTVTLTNGSPRDMMLLKMNSSLVAQWGVRNNGNLSSNPTGLFIDQSSNLYVSGTFNLSSIVFGANTLNNPSSGFDGFLLKYDLSGTNLSVKGTAGMGDEQLNGVVVDVNGNIFVTGSYSPTLTLAGTTLGGYGAKELFIAKLCMVPAGPSVVNSVTLCAKRTATITATVPPGSIANWYNAPTGGNLLLGSNNTFTTNNSGTYYVESYNSTTGCSSSTRAATTVSVQPGASVTVSGKTLTASSGSSYKWYECHKDSVAAGATGQTFTLGASGYYAAIVTNNGCVDTSACKFYSVNAVTGTITVPGDTVKIDSTKTALKNIYAVKRSLLIFPNPNAGDFTVRSTESAVCELTNLLGQQVKQIRLTVEGEYSFTVTGLASGIYILSGERIKTQRVVVTR